MTLITPEQARGYLERWEPVRRAEIEQLRRTSMQTKLQQLCVLVASGGLFAPNSGREDSIRKVRERWIRIRGSSPPDIP